MSDAWVKTFDRAMHRAFSATGLGAYSDAVVQKQCGGALLTGCRCIVNHDVEYIGEQAQVPQLVTTVEVFRADTGDLSRLDLIVVGGIRFAIDSACIESEGELDTYIVVPER